MAITLELCEVIADCSNIRSDVVPDVISLLITSVKSADADGNRTFDCDLLMDSSRDEGVCFDDAGEDVDANESNDE